MRQRYDRWLPAGHSGPLVPLPAEPPAPPPPCRVAVRDAGEPAVAPACGRPAGSPRPVLVWLQRTTFHRSVRRVLLSAPWPSGAFEAPDKQVLEVPARPSSFPQSGRERALGQGPDETCPGAGRPCRAPGAPSGNTCKLTKPPGNAPPSFCGAVTSLSISKQRQGRDWVPIVPCRALRHRGRTAGLQGCGEQGRELGSLSADPPPLEPKTHKQAPVDAPQEA